MAQLMSRAADDEAVGGGQLPVSRPIGGGLQEVVVKGPIDLEHQRASVGELPLAVRVAASPRSVEAWLLGDRQGHPETAARPTDLDLRERLCTRSDVVEQDPNALRAGKGPQPVQPE